MGTDRHPGYDSPAGYRAKPWVPPTLRSTIERYMRDEGWIPEGDDVWVQGAYRLRFMDAVDRQMAVEATTPGSSAEVVS